MPGRKFDTDGYRYDFKDRRKMMEIREIDGKQEDVIVMKFSSLSLAFHEAKHGYQHIVGDVEFISEDQTAKYVDLFDEQQSYVRQYYFDTKAFNKTVTSNSIVKSSRDITFKWIQGIVHTKRVGIANFLQKGPPVYSDLDAIPMSKSTHSRKLIQR